MARALGIGYQSFEQIIVNHNFYVDKTMFIKEWWENQDAVTLITRPRRFGKTLTMSMTEQFFSLEYANRGELFQGLSIWREEKYRKLQGTYPVIALSFAGIKETSYEDAVKKIKQLLAGVYAKHYYLLDSEVLTPIDKRFFQSISVDMDTVEASLAIHRLSEYLFRYYGKKVLILLDEYDTPLQEAYVRGYWKELVAFTRNLFNSAFKTNPYLDRAIMTGITRVSKESIFSDLNNLVVVTTTSDSYMDSFGFTEQEVWEALEEFKLSEKKEEVKGWYDGFTFGTKKDIYNPWSIINYLKTGIFSAYWANTSSNSLAGRLIRGGSSNIKLGMEELMRGRTIQVQLDEQIVFDQLDQDENAVWSLLLASGYLKVRRYEAHMTEFGDWIQSYELELTNFEVRVMFRGMIQSWFGVVRTDYNEFIRALLLGDTEAMNEYMNRVSEAVFSSFDTGGKSSGRTEPERFYHGFVLGLMMDLNDRYVITSNRESGFGRYDLQLEPRRETDDAILIEFKVRNQNRERSLKDTVQEALAQIEERKYGAALEARGVRPERIRKLGFAFEGRQVLIGSAGSMIDEKDRIW